MQSKKTYTETNFLSDEDWPAQGPFGSCRRTDQLLADYVERAEALAVHTEILYRAHEAKSPLDWSAAWSQAEDALNNAGMARFALAQRIRNAAIENGSGAKVVSIKQATARR